MQLHGEFRRHTGRRGDPEPAETRRRHNQSRRRSRAGQQSRCRSQRAQAVCAARPRSGEPFRAGLEGRRFHALRLRSLRIRIRQHQPKDTSKEPCRTRRRRRWRRRKDHHPGSAHVNAGARPLAVDEIGFRR